MQSVSLRTELNIHVYNRVEIHLIHNTYINSLHFFGILLQVLKTVPTTQYVWVVNMTSYAMILTRWKISGYFFPSYRSPLWRDNAAVSHWQHSGTIAVA